MMYRPYTADPLECVVLQRQRQSVSAMRTRNDGKGHPHVVFSQCCRCLDAKRAKTLATLTEHNVSL